MTASRNQKAPWAPYARTLIRRLRAEPSDDILDPDKEETPSETPAPTIFDALGAIAEVQHRSSEEIDALREAGHDGLALGEDGDDRPARPLPVAEILATLRLAATFGTESVFREQCLARDAITVVSGIPLDALTRTASLVGRLMLQGGWELRTRAGPREGTPVLLLCRPDPGDLTRVSARGCRSFYCWIEEALGLPHPILVLQPEGVPLPDRLARLLPAPVPLAQLDREMVAALLEQTHSATGQIDREVVMPRLPTDGTLAYVDLPTLQVALRAPSAAEAAHRLAQLTAAPEADTGALTLEAIGGTSPAHRAAAGLVADLEAWRAGRVRWSEVSRSLLLHGAPGTGKTVLARAIARSAGATLVEGSFGEWQAAGHLGDMLREMCRSFEEARSAAPAVLFIDEIDSAGSRFGGDRHGMSYRRQVINEILHQVDRLALTEGVVLVAACNDPDALDPAIRRPGRFDLVHEMPRPTLSEIGLIVARHLPEAPADTITALARRFSGQTPATVDAHLREARAAARRTGRALDARLLLDELREATEDAPNLLRRIALHEVGHAMAATLLGGTPVRRITLADGHGETRRGSCIQEGTIEEYERELAVQMAGRAAERLVLGSITSGAGGGEDSDLSQATRLVLHLDRQSGLGIHGPAWLGETSPAWLDAHTRRRVRAKLEQAERRARQLLEPRQARLVAIAEALVEHREFDETSLAPWLSDLESVSLDEPP